MKNFVYLLKKPISILLILVLGAGFLSTSTAKAFYFPTFSFAPDLPGFDHLEDDHLNPFSEKFDPLAGHPFFQEDKKVDHLPDHLDPFSDHFDPLGDDFLNIPSLVSKIPHPSGELPFLKGAESEKTIFDFDQGEHDFQFFHGGGGDFDQFFQGVDHFQPKQPEERSKEQEVSKKPIETPTSDLEKLRNEVVAETNRIRRENSLIELSVDPLLTQAAQRHAEDMAKNNYFSHTSQDGRAPADRIRNAGYQSTCSAENIAYGQKTPEIVMQDWINSEGHRKNILWEPIKEIGVGVASDEEGRIYWVQNFGCGK